jgi:hypothetical protein
MKTLTKRGMRFAFMTLGFAGLFVAVNAVPGAATSGVGFDSYPKARGYLAHGSLHVNPGADVVVSENIVAKGGSSGWHSHPGGAIVIVKQGQITTYRSVASDRANGDGNAGNFMCVKTTYDAGKAFIETPGEALNAVNTYVNLEFPDDPEKNKTIIWAVFPGVAHPNGSPRTDVSPNPGTCSKYGV